MRPVDNLPDFDSLWDYRKPAETEAAFRELLARAQGEACTALQLGSLPPRVRVRHLLERGRVFNSARQPEQARPLFLEAWEAARAAEEDDYAVDAAHMMGIVEPPAEQLAWGLKALAAAEARAQPRARDWLGSLYNNLGWTYHDLGDWEQALDLFRRGQAWREAKGEARETRIARWAVARCLRSLGRLDEALAIQRELEQENARLGEKDGYVHEELGELLLALDRTDEARPQLVRAHELFSQDPWLSEREPERLARLRRLSVGG
jgi:tetratricopeptide (TPR) repeat protein